jgi:hypothetical protein
LSVSVNEYEISLIITASSNWTRDSILIGQIPRQARGVTEFGRLGCIPTYELDDSVPDMAMRDMPIRRFRDGLTVVANEYADVLRSAHDFRLIRGG